MTTRLVQRVRPETCLSDLAIEGLLVGEPPADDPSRPGREAHLGSCERCRQRRDELAAAPEQSPDRSWWREQSTTPATTASTTAAQPPRAKRRTRAIFGGGALGVFAMAATLVFLLRPRSSQTDATLGDTRAKGAAFVFETVARHGDGSIEQVFDGTVLHPNDQIRFVITSFEKGPAAAHLAIVGLDSAGHVSTYFPPTGENREDLLSAGRHELPGSVILDTTLGSEAIVALVCRQSLDPATLTRAGREALQGMGTKPPSHVVLDVPCQQSALTIRKLASDR